MSQGYRGFWAKVFLLTTIGRCVKKKAVNLSSPGGQNRHSQNGGPGPKWRKEYLELLGYSSVGLEMGLAVGIGVLIGWLLDRRLVWTSPWLTLFFMAMGIIAAGRAFYRAAVKIRARQVKGDGRNRPDSTGG